MEEAVDRYFDYLINRFKLESYDQTLEDCRIAMKNKEIFGSMRALMTAGPALDGDDVAAYNCSYVAVSKLEDFRNIMYILMCGTGVGFSVEKDGIDQLPVVSSSIIKDFSNPIIVEDSRAGWADAYFTFINGMWNGNHQKD